jgi:hypothetical protein
MSAGQITEPLQGFRKLHDFARRARPVERCELCGLGVHSDHPHLIELARHQLLCACDACAILFCNQGSKYKRVPRRILYLPHFQLADAEWNSLMIPINMAFFFQSTTENRVVALYPSPAGATESLLTLESWNDIVSRNTVLHQMEPDVEGLLVNRLGYAHDYTAPQYYLLPIDECYKLVGLIRMYWKGLSGGTEVWQQLANFFLSLQARAVEAAPLGTHAAKTVEAVNPAAIKENARA